jgi:Zn-dependent peptidase ImmA (M78 family)
LREWTAAAERAGVLVFQFSGVEVEEARGFSLSERPLPVIALNGKDSPRGRIFTLFHELAHITLDLSGLCDLHESAAEGWVEPFCNAVAGEALVPVPAIRSQPEVAGHATGPEWSDEDLRVLANRFMVSRETLLRRLLTLNLTTEAFYARKRAEFVEDYRRLRQESGGFLRYFIRVLRDNGQAYTSLLFDAYDQQAITARDLSHYLGDVKLKHVDTIRGAMSGAVD